MRDYLRSVTSRAWTTTSTKHLLTNEVYRGVLQFGQWRNEAAWEPVIDPSTWQAVQDAVARIGSERGPRPESASDFTYYLRGRVHCPHCGCLYTQASHHGRNRRVHYYLCLQHKRRGDCPVGRINAAHLHETALHFLHYTASHKTVLHKLIAQSGGWGQADEAQTAQRGLLAKKKQFLEMQIANFVKAVGEGRCSPSIMAALEKAEAEQQAVQTQLEDAERAVRQATRKRPTAERVAQAWGRIGEVWPVLSEEEREGVLGGVVQGVTVTGKEEVTLELLPMPLPLDPSAISHSLGFNLERELGAGVGLEPTTFGLCMLLQLLLPGEPVRSLDFLFILALRSKESAIKSLHLPPTAFPH